MPTKRRQSKRRRTDKPLRVAGLFAGIGGLELGLKRAGLETALLCEIDPGARAVLSERFSGVKVIEDVAEIKKLPNKIDVLVAGFPCQDLSQVGPTVGIKGKKSGLVAHVWRLLASRKIGWVILENVPFMLKLHGGAALDVIVGMLESLGYKWAYRVIDSRAFGLPQRRERVFIVASLKGDPRAVLFSDDAGAPAAKPTAATTACGFYWTEGNTGIGWAVDAVPPLKGGSGVGIPSPPAIFLPPFDFVTPHIRDAERMQGFSPGWTKPADAHVRRGRRKGQRWKLVGNAVTVPIAEWIGRRLLRPGKYTDEKTELSDDRWPRAAWGDGSGKRYVSDVSAWPVARKTKSLRKFLKDKPAPLAYRAAAGFLSRLEASSLRTDDAFLSALRSYVKRLAPKKQVRA